MVHRSPLFSPVASGYKKSLEHSPDVSTQETKKKLPCMIKGAVIISWIRVYEKIQGGGGPFGLTYQSVRHLHLPCELKLLTTHLQGSRLDNICIPRCLKLGTGD